MDEVHPMRARISVAVAIATTLPALSVRLTDPSLPYPVQALVFGAAIVGAAFMISWAAEVAQLDISAGLAIAILALIAVLPEYAVDFVFASKGGQSFLQTGARCLPLDGGGESPCSLALANMTGANRLLIGVGWSMVVFIAFWRLKKTGSIGRGREWTGIRLDREHSIEIAYLAAATLYSLTLPLKHSVMPIDAVVLVGIFILYTLRVSRAPAEEPHLVGPAAYIGTLSVSARRWSAAALAAFAAAVILLSAERFAEALVDTGRAFNISEFLLVQWVAPLASETPELLIAALYAWRLNTSLALGTLVSSKVNQWTLLVGTLPVVFAISARGLHGLPLDTVQREELFLTGAQSFFAVAVLLGLTLSLREASFLLGMFLGQFIIGGVVPESLRGIERVGTGIAYLLLGVWVLLGDRSRIRQLFRDGFVASYDELGAERAMDQAKEEGRLP